MRQILNSQVREIKTYGSLSEETVLDLKKSEVLFLHKYPINVKSAYNIKGKFAESRWS